MLILLRHGQTTSNVDHLLDTRLPGAELTELGREQARAAGEQILQDYDVDRVITSQAVRARQTGQEAFGSAFDEIPAVDGIHEIDAGRYEMQNSDEAHRAYLTAFRGFYRRELATLIDDGDSLDTFLTRYKAGLDPWVDPEKTTVVVSHGGAIRAYSANAAAVDPGFAEASYLPNCSFVVLNPVGEFGSWRVEKWADYDLPKV